MNNPVMKIVFDWSKILFTPLALGFVGYFAWQSREMLADLITEANFFFLFLSFLCWVIVHFISPVFTVIVMKDYSSSLTYKEAFLIHASRLPARYLPGGIWHTVARVADYKSKNISLAGIGYYLLLEHMVAASVTLSVGGAVVVIMSMVDDYWLVLVALIALMSGMLLVTLPGILSMIRTYKEYSVSVISYVQGVMLVMVFWCVAAISFVLFLKAFDSVVLEYSDIGMGGIYMFSWGIGFLAVFAPQGIGVAEFVSGSLLRPDIPLASFIVLLASFRINIFLADIAAWLISYRVRA